MPASKRSSMKYSCFAFLLRAMVEPPWVSFLSLAMVPSDEAGCLVFKQEAASYH
jgi:hypothetical protein